MEQKNISVKNKGGRPKKVVTKKQRIPIKCTSDEKKAIQEKAKQAGFSTSEYLLQLGLNKRIDSRVKTLPKEVLLLTGRLNHIAASLNQLARKRNSLTDVLTLTDRVDLMMQTHKLKELVTLIRKYLQ